MWILAAFCKSHVMKCCIQGKRKAKRFETFVAVSLKSPYFWNVTLDHRVCASRRCEGPFFLYLQGV
jgi:hypothetical protein